METVTENLKLLGKFIMYVFFCRYLFRKALVEDEFARQEAVEKKKLKEKEIGEDHVKWDQGKSYIFSAVYIIHIL